MPVTWLAQPVFVPVPVIPPVGDILTLTAADSVATAEAATQDFDYDVIELSAVDGNFDWQNWNIDVDRTARPLTIRPVPGHAIVFDGDPTTTGIILNVGDNSITKYLTVTGAGGSWTFQDSLLAQSGVIEVRGSDFCTFSFLTFQNIGRDLGVPGTGEHKSYMFYISGDTTSNDNLVLDNCRFKAPAVYRDVSCLQVASTGSHGHITISNVLEMTDYHYALSVDVPVSNLELVNWVMDDCGRTAAAASIRFFPVSINGSYTNIDATASEPLRDDSTGTMTDGGGNSGI